MTKQSTLESIRSNLEHLGARRTLMRISSRALRRTLRYHVHQCISLTRETMRLEHEVDELPYVYRFLDLDEIHRHAEDPENRLGARFIAEALESGYTCCGAFEEDQLVSYAWFSERPSRIVRDLYLGFDERCIYGMNGFTRRSHRGKRINSYINACALEDSKPRGRSVIVSLVDPRNYVSLASARHTGYQPCGRIHILGRGPRRLILHGRKCADLGLRLGSLDGLRGSAP